MGMSFGEKLYTLRKKQGLSQEELGELVNTTRQAISKWENDQGYPETEKLLLLSNIFAVSIDFLLKNEPSTNEVTDNRYFVDTELANAYIRSESKANHFLGLGFMFFVFIGIPFVLIRNQMISWICMICCFILGLVFIILSMYIEKDMFYHLKQKSLLFDHDAFKALEQAYQQKKKSYRLIAFFCTCLFVLCTLTILFTMEGLMPWGNYHVFAFIGLGISLYAFIKILGVLNAYELLIRNEQYCNRFGYKVKMKIKKMMDEF